MGKRLKRYPKNLVSAQGTSAKLSSLSSTTVQLRTKGHAADFHNLVLTYKALHGLGPEYLRETLLPITATLSPVRSHRRGLLGV
ncbi:hypothetical protein L345_13102, partial [Ophiophagus hannah]